MFARVVGKYPDCLFSFCTFAATGHQEIMKVREVIPHTGPIPIVIPLKLFLDLLRDPVFPRGLTDSQSHVLIFTNVDS